MEQLLLWVKKLAVFMILCSYMEHLLPSQYKRYFHMCTGLILILMITTPLLRIVRGDISSEVLCLVENLKTGSSVYSADSKDSEAYRLYYMAQYRQAIMEQIESLAAANGLKAEQIEFSVDEDAESDGYGSLTELSMCIEMANGSDADVGVRNQFRKTLGGQLGLAEGNIHFNDPVRDSGQGGR